MAEEQKGNETTEAAAAGGGSGQTKKRKKINRFTPQELLRKIEEVEKAGGKGSIYYRHLIQRKNELGL